MRFWRGIGHVFFEAYCTFAFVSLLGFLGSFFDDRRDAGSLTTFSITCGSEGLGFYDKLSFRVSFYFKGN